MTDTKTLIEWADKHLMTTAKRNPVVLVRGEGARVWDSDGKEYLDFTGGIGCLAVGHSHPRVVEAAQEQAALFTHTDYTIVPYENYVGLAERLCDLAPISGQVRAGFFNSGAEAVENAVKFARSYTKRPAVIAFDGAFHGRTLMAMSLTSKTHPYKAGLGPFAPEVYRVSFADPYRGPDVETALAELRRAFKTRVAAEDVAAIIFEPVQGESGFVTPPKEFLQGVREIASEHGIVLIVDEVQTGFGRTGTMFAIEQFGVEPDLMVVAKSVAAGLPLSGVIGRAEIMDAPGDSAIGGTYVGNPVSIAAAHAVLDVIDEERLVERANAIGQTIRQRMEGWRERFDCIGCVRGLGAMLAVELVRDRETREPDPDLATAVVEGASARGLLLLKAGLYGNCIRVLAPLVVTDEQLDEALGAWEEAFAEATGSHHPHVDSAASTT